MASIYDKETGLISENIKIDGTSQAQQGSFPLPTSSNTTTSSTLSDKENENNNSGNILNKYNSMKDHNLLDYLSAVYNKNEIEGT